ncbi:MAG: putative metal-dependent hydrolase [Calditrichaeota bacterium]|nr:putative metal-dependent hydrolase [Calditrichota bacterium]
MDDTLRYPIGKVEYSEPVTDAQRRERAEAIRMLPFELAGALRGLTDAQLDTPYRDGGWTVRQVVHHLCDVGVTLYLRTKQILLEDCPRVTGYDDQAMLGMGDARSSTEAALKLLEGLHTRWAALFASLYVEQLRRTYIHFRRGEESLDVLLAHAAWHCRHHTAHITKLRERMGW